MIGPTMAPTTAPTSGGTGGVLTPGLDASSAQVALPFDALVKAGIRWVALKAQQGNDGFDPWFARNLRGALDRGLEVFAYCFAYPLSHLDPVAQGRAFVDAIAAHDGGVLRGRRVLLDYEWPEIVARPTPGGGATKGWREWGCSPAQLADWMRVNAASVAEASGVAPAIYTYPSWWAAIRDGAPAYGFPAGGDVSWAAAYDLWIASYVHAAPKAGDAPRIPRPWTTWRMWQWDGTGGTRMPNGVDADFCVFNGSLDELRAWATGGGAPAPAPIDVNTVRGLQARLVALGFDPGAVDGVRGVKTDAAVRAFQQSRGLTPDGVVGPQTRAALAA